MGTSTEAASFKHRLLSEKDKNQALLLALHLDVRSYIYDNL